MSWTHLSDTTPTARKGYRCYLCWGFIPKGEKHLARRGISDEGPTTTRMHPECEELTKKWDVGDWESFGCGEFERPLP